MEIVLKLRKKPEVQSLFWYVFQCLHFVRELPVHVHYNCQEVRDGTISANLLGLERRMGDNSSTGEMNGSQ